MPQIPLLRGVPLTLLCLWRHCSVTKEVKPETTSASALCEFWSPFVEVKAKHSELGGFHTSVCPP